MAQIKKGVVMLSYEERSKLCTNPTAARLLQLMAEKKTNLAASIDVVAKKELVSLVNCIGPEICILKTHIDILEDFDSNLIQELKFLARKHGFLIFEDRKFADIGHTVRLQYEKGIYQIANWAHITNAHTVPGPSIIEGLKEVGLPLGNGLLLLAEMSSKDNLATAQYIQKTVQMALQHKDFVIGFIAQNKLLDDPAFIHLTPGVQTGNASDRLGQQYTTPEDAILRRGTDVIIVGRGIYHAGDPLAATKHYRQLGWEAYLKRLHKSSAQC